MVMGVVWVCVRWECIVNFSVDYINIMDVILSKLFLKFGGVFFLFWVIMRYVFDVLKVLKIVMFDVMIKLVFFNECL